MNPKILLTRLPLLVLLILGISLAFLVTAVRADAHNRIIVNPTSGLVTTEKGGKATFTVVLERAPLFAVKIGLSSSNTNEGVVDPTSVSFNFTNWNAPQIVTVTGVDDTLVDGDIAYQVITAPANSLDGYFSGVDPSDVGVLNWDNEGGPVATDDAAATDEDTPVNIKVLDNDQGVGGVILTVPMQKSPHGNAKVNPDKTITYTPDAAYFGADTFGYGVCDDRERCSTAKVNVTVNEVIKPPVAVDDQYTVDQDTPLAVPDPGVLSNDEDPKNRPLAAVLISEPLNGTLSLNADGSFSYQPFPRFAGEDQFSYQANDGKFDSNPAQVLIEVKDIEKPIVQWVEPDQGEQVYDVGLGTFLLVADAADNTEIERVYFYRWDPSPDVEEYKTIGHVYEPPYQWELDTSQLRLGWNQVFVRAYDLAGNESERQFVWLYQTGFASQVYLPFINR